jgi:photosystem II stability/assembly factor-like uncharacterized protein
MRSLMTFTVISLLGFPMYAQDFWERTNSPGNSARIVAINSSGHLFAAIAGLGMFRTKNDGDSWTPISGGLAFSQVTGLAIDNRDGSVLVSASNGTDTQNELFRSTDNGNSWSLIAAMGSRYIIAINQSGHVIAGKLLSMGRDTLFRSTDDGQTWMPTGLTRKVFYCAINANGHIFACSGTHLYRSIDNGSTWANVRPDSVGGLYGSVAFSPLGTTFLTEYEPSEVGMYSRIWRSTNKGDTWSIVRPWSFGVNNPLAVNSSGHVFTASSEVIRSTNDGMTWEDVSSGLPRNPGYFISSLAVNSKDRIFAASIAVYRSSRSTTSAENGKELPAAFALAQNYPNPFNPSTAIGFQVTAYSHVRLSIYDLLGREVATLVNEVKAPGSYEVTWDAGGMASGVYLYRLNAGDFTQTKRLLLLH